MKKQEALLLIEKRLNKLLEGKELTAFGKNSEGLWGSSKREKKYTVKLVSVDESIDLKYVEFIIVLNKYNAKRTGLIYTDTKFLSSLYSTLGFKIKEGDLDYTEQGMQGKDYVSLYIKNPKKYLLK